MKLETRARKIAREVIKTVRIYEEYKTDVTKAEEMEQVLTSFINWQLEIVSK